MVVWNGNSYADTMWENPIMLKYVHVWTRQKVQLLKGHQSKEWDFADWGRAEQMSTKRKSPMWVETSKPEEGWYELNLTWQKDRVIFKEGLFYLASKGRALFLMLGLLLGSSQVYPSLFGWERQWLTYLTLLVGCLILLCIFYLYFLCWLSMFVFSRIQ